ncbi:unnamed protein product [Effrenium voratum]|nr:unnamed protein product [Effrenium voratum]
MRNSANLERIQVPLEEPSHFGLYMLSSSKRPAPPAPAVLFVPGHGGSWKQGINLCAYLAKKDALHYYAADFHASASALHSSVVTSQALFTAKARRQWVHHQGMEAYQAARSSSNTNWRNRVPMVAIERIRKLHSGPLVLLGHSMGGIVALRAIAMGAARPDAVLLVSAPLQPHPLLLEPRFQAVQPVSFSWDLRLVSVSGGPTDPLVPMHTARPRTGVFQPLPGARDVYASFSHVNLLFSRHSLHFLAQLLRGLAKREELKSSPWRQLLNSSTSTPLPAPEAFSSQSMGGEAVPLSRLDQTQLFPRSGGVFSFLLMEEPKPIRRQPESSTRGETFDPADRLNCSEAVLAWEDEKASWRQVEAISMQFPVKACLLQLQPPGEATRVVLTPPAKARRVGWAQPSVGWS